MDPDHDYNRRLIGRQFMLALSDEDVGCKEEERPYGRTDNQAVPHSIDNVPF